MGRANVSDQVICYVSDTIQITSEAIPLIGDGVAVVTAGNGGGTRQRSPSPTSYMAGVV